MEVDKLLKLWQVLQDVINAFKSKSYCLTIMIWAGISMMGWGALIGAAMYLSVGVPLWGPIQKPTNSENGISTKHFKDLINDNEYLKELCPIIGTYMDIKQKITEYLEAHQADTETIEIPETSLDVRDLDVRGNSTLDLIMPSEP